MSAAPLSGGCLCGAVRFKATPPKPNMDACHCGMCRRWTGGPWLTVSCDHAVEIEDETHLGVYVSSDWAERCFCKNCGGTLFWRMRDGSMTTVSAQAFDDPGQFKFVDEIYIDEKPANYEFANSTHKMTGAEVVAMFSALKG